MLSVIIKAIFYVITKLFSLIMAPFYLAITALFPDLGLYINRIMLFLATAFTYFSSCLSLLLVPRNVLLLLFDYFLIKYSIYLIRNGINLVVRIYNNLKP